MAATALTAQQVPHSGLAVVYSTPTQTTGHTAPCSGDMALIIKNGGSANYADLHIPAANTVDGLVVATPAGGAAPARRVTVAAGDTVIPLPDTVYADPANSGLVTFDLQATTSITMACVRIA